MEPLTISKAAQQAGVGVETIRFYERKGLIEQPLKPLGGGYRTYTNETVQRIRFIRQAQELGFSLTEIEELLDMRTTPGTDCGDIHQRAAAKLADVDRKVEALTRIREALKEVIAACPGQGGLEGCSIIGAMEKKKEG